MSISEIKNYGRRTVIPDYLKPLPKIDSIYARNFQLQWKTPKSLMKLCFYVLEKLEINSQGRKKWMDFESIFSYSSKIVTNSFYKLCHIKNPISSTMYLKQKSWNQHVTVEEFLKMAKIIREETLELQRLENPLNHWEKIPSYKKSYKSVLIARKN